MEGAYTHESPEIVFRLLVQAHVCILLKKETNFHDLRGLRNTAKYGFCNQYFHGISHLIAGCIFFMHVLFPSLESLVINAAFTHPSHPPACEQLHRSYGGKKKASMMLRCTNPDMRRATSLKTHKGNIFLAVTFCKTNQPINPATNEALLICYCNFFSFKFYLQPLLRSQTYYIICIYVNICLT